MIIFVHIPRTSGRYVLQHIIPRHNHMKFHKKMPRLYQGGYEVSNSTIISGHIPFGIHSLMDIKGNSDEVNYITFLRDPLNRWISQFNYSVAFKRTIFKTWIKCNKNIIKVLDECINNGMNSNLMVKQMSGAEKLENGTNKKHMYMWSPRECQYTADDMESMLALAQNNTSKFAIIGRSGEKKHYKQLFRFFGKSYRKFSRVNTARRKIPSINWEDVRVKSRLDKLNEYDIKLFNFVIGEIWK